MTLKVKFLVIVFDGLRRDMITPERAPNLFRFLAAGSDFPLSRSVFPTMTRVNAAALGAGTATGGHGIVANKYFDPLVFRDRIVSTDKIADIEAIEGAYHGRLVSASTLGEVLAQAGLRLAVVSTATAGTTRLVNPNAKSLGHASLCLRAWESSTPVDFARDTLNIFGAIPPASRPNTARLKLQTKMFVEHVFPRFQPDVSILWYSDPDSTYHNCGIGSPESRAAIGDVDWELGLLLDWWQNSAHHEQLQIFVVSDHGHITARRKIDVEQEFARASLPFGNHLRDDARFTGSLGYAGALWVRDGNSRYRQVLVDWLCEQPWCGMVFSAGGSGGHGASHGTLHRSLLLADHPRAPDIYFLMRTDDQVDAQGIDGGCYYDAPYPEGGSTHGGLHPRELNNLLVARGTLFHAAYRSNFPAGIIDVAPTILRLLGLEPPRSMTGRVLAEALAAVNPEPPEPKFMEWRVDDGARSQRLQQARVGTTVYVNGGWLEPPPRLT